MENNGDLEEFRKQWKIELTRCNLPEDQKEKSKHSSEDHVSDTTDSSRTAEDLHHHPVFGVEESKRRPNTYQSFLLAEDLLKQNDSLIHETYSSNVLLRKRKRSSCCDLKDLNNTSTSSTSTSPCAASCKDVGLSPEPKVPKPDDEKTQVESKERFLDIFLADLVSHHNRKHNYDIE